MSGIEQRDVHRAREQFLADGHLDPDVACAVRPDILASWRRSRLSGAKSGVDACPPAPDFNLDSPLLRAAEPVLAQLAERLTGLPAGVLLADRKARILRQWVTEPGILRELDRINSFAGASASEEFIGTNGVGTVAELRAPQIVMGAEHFADMASVFLCVGAPVFHPVTRKFEGIVTLNSDTSCASPLLSALVVGTTQEIERRLLELSSRRERELLDTFLVAGRSGRTVAVVGDSVTLVGPRATRLLGGVDQAELWARIREGASGSWREQRIDVSVGERVVSLSCAPVLIESEVIGALVEVVEPAPGSRRPAPASLLIPAEWPAGRELQRGRGSPAWLATVRSAAKHRSGTAPVLVLGEAGTGKLTVVKAMFGPTLTVLDCMTAQEEPASWTAALRAAAAGPADAVVVLRHVDALDPLLAGRVSAQLDVLAEQAAAPRIVGTASPAQRWPGDAVFQRLANQLGVGRVELPPLRECRDDIPELVQVFVARYAAGAPLTFAADVMRALRRASWPGNVRQLENVVRSLAETAPERQVTPEMLPADLRGPLTGRALTKLEQVEYDAIVATIDQSGGNKVATAKLLGISRSTLYRKMRSYHLDPDRTFH